jgi:GntR family transcriptional regulator / MocR family aminotransferase
METLVGLDRSRAGYAEQVATALREAIADGRLAPGSRLPASRELAADLRVSRGVVVGAYEQLVAEGRLVTRRGSATVVAVAATPAAPATPGPATGLLYGEPGRAAPLRPGVPDLAAFPRAAWRRAYESALGSATDADLGYGDPSGAPRLRRELADYLGRVRAARLGADDVVVTTGAAQAFVLVAQLLRGRGATAIALEDPGSPGIRGHLEGLGLRLVPIPVDAGGLDVHALERSDVAAVLVTPAHQFPTGVVLAPARRAALVDWARRFDGLIVEDDYDAEFRYDRDPVGCLQGFAPDVTAYIGSVSKALAPALRLGWLAVPPKHRSAVRAAKAAADLGGPVLEHLAFAELLACGGYDRHLRRTRRAQRERRDALVAALAAHLPAARICGVAAGLHLVVELPDGTDDAALAARARAVGLEPLALSATRSGPAGGPGLVLGYAGHPPARLAEAVRRLADLVADE